MTRPNVNPLVARFSGELALIEESMAPRIDAAMEVLSSHEHGAELLAETAGASDTFWPAADDWRAAYRPYVIDKGVLQIPVKGVLLHNFPWALGGWATGYVYIQRAIERGCEDFAAGNIKGIAFVVDSGGGFVAGLYDLLDAAAPLIRACGVPVRAFVQNSAYSAAYAVITLAAASPDGKIVVNKVGGTGSIGTLATHIDWSGWNEKMGLKYTFLHAGECKVDGSPEMALSDRARKRIQSRVNELNELFIAVVAEARQIAPAIVRGFEAATFTPSESMSNGLADEIGSLDDALAAFAADLSESTGDETMTTATKDTSATVTRADHDTAIAAARAEGVTEGTAAGRTAGLAEGTTAERTRIAAILGCDEAKTRPAAAMAVAMQRSDSLEDAQGFLASMPVEAKASNNGPGFKEAMDQQNPDLGGGGGNEGEEGTDDGSATISLARSVGLSGVRPAPKV
jgi:ClpP class serine protease